MNGNKRQFSGKKEASRHSLSEGSNLNLITLVRKDFLPNHKYNDYFTIHNFFIALHS